MADEVDFEPEYEEEQPMDDVDGGDGDAPGVGDEEMVQNGGAAAAPGGKGRKAKGRGHQNTSMEVEDRYILIDKCDDMAEPSR